MVNPGSSFSEWYGDGTFKMLLDNTLNPSDEKVYSFLDKVFGG
jgi:hexosaminidase